MDQVHFEVMGYEVVVKDTNIAKALQTLPKKKRDVILLSFFLEMVMAADKNRAQAVEQSQARMQARTADQDKEWAYQVPRTMRAEPGNR